MCVPECDDSSCRINVERGAIYGICLRGTDIRISDVKRWVPDCSSRLYNEIYQSTKFFSTK